MDFAVSQLAQFIHRFLYSELTPDSIEFLFTSLFEESFRFLGKFPKAGTGLERRIREAANEAEDILKHFTNDQIRSIRSAINEFTRLIEVISLSTDNPSDYFHQLKKVMLEINPICRNVKSLNITKNEQRELIKKIFGSPTDNPRYDFGKAKVVMVESNSISRTTADVNVVVGDSPPTVRYAAGGVTVGLDDDVLKIKDLLTGGSSELHTIPIAGMGGIGKSTLAMNAYNDPLIMETFTVRAWVTVSQDYKTENVFSVLVDFFKEVGDVRSGKTTMEKVYKFLYGRKYLIVLDDIWSTQAWDDVKKAFPDGGDGSRIILTTRIQDVASHASSLNYIHQMSFMDEYRSWDLLKQKVFANKCCPSALVDVGMDIARSCRGLPLAIVLVAGILSTVNETRFSWLEVAKKVRLCVNEEGGRFEKVISLSYTHLPHQLRVCFLYMGGFPEDYEIRVSKLIKLWIAEGFVEPRSGKSLEECGEELLDDLVKRSLALVTKRKSNGKNKSCNVHDLVRDICRRKAQEENLERCRSVAHPNLMFLSKIYSSTMRSVTCFRPSRSELVAVTGFTLLRVLDLVEAFFDSFPVPVLDLFHLRYLGFSFRGVIEIPAAISRLQNLLTLMIYSRSSKCVLHLPFEIWMMPLLTHLVSSCHLSLHLDGVASTLHNLATLSEVRRFTCSKKMTQMIPNIKKLGITYCDNNDAGDYELHNLVLLHQLENLKLNGYGVSLKVNPVFPQTLKKLTLSGWRFPWKYMETVGSLPNLQVLKLRCYACDGHTWETKEEQFLSLEFLYIYNSCLENLVTESSHFPKLKRLVFFRCSRLSEIPDDIGEIPTLQLIEVDSKNTALLKCARKIQEDQRDNGNYDLQVGCLYDQVLEKPRLFDSLFEDILRLKCMISTVELYEKTNAAKAEEERDCILRKGEEKELACRKGPAAGLKNWHFRGVGRYGPLRRQAQSGGQKNPHFGGSARGSQPRKRT